MGTRAKQSTIGAAVRVALLASCPWLAAQAGAPLPVACPGGPCGAGVGFVSSGSASWAQSGAKLTVNQTSTNAILNWQSFNIATGNTVQFVQPSTSSVALNEIFDSNPTQISGALNANGRVFLINQNGIIFGAGATVNAGGLVASTLQITPSAATSGLVIPGEGSLTSVGQPAFQAVPGANGTIKVQQGATLATSNGGQIYLFAPAVTNLGSIQTPGGQTILAAGTSVYLASSDDPSLRGMLVEVGGPGTVTNGIVSNSDVTSPQQLVGQIAAQDGNISLAALAVNQYGRLSATTSVDENGSIYLQARNGTISSQASNPGDIPGSGGTLTLGQNSDTEVTLDTASDATEADNVGQPPSTIMMSGKTIDMLQGSVARATGGVIDVYAATNLGGSDNQAGLYDELGTSSWNNGFIGLTDSSDGSRFYMASGSVLDVSGASITLPVGDDVISADLESSEFADSPLQRGGPLQGQTIDFDINAHGTNSDGSEWWGTPLANVEGEILAMGRSVVERNLDGGTVSIQSQGDVVLAPTSTIDISGGYVQYTGDYLDTSELLTLWGQLVPVASANADIPYAGVVTTTTTTDAKWGVTQTSQTTPSYYSPGYIQGYDAGTIKLSAPGFIMDGTVSAGTVVGPYQTQPTSQRDSLTWVQDTGSTGAIQYSMYRPYDEVPAGATLVIGTPTGADEPGDFIVGGVTIASGMVLPGLQNADGSAFNPLVDPLPASLTTSTLQPGTLDQFQNVQIYTNGKLTEVSGVGLTLAAGGSFAGQAASIDIEGGINIPSGTVSLTAEPTYAEASEQDIDTTLTLGPGASLTAIGAWINDSNALYPNGNTAPVYINGGSVTLTAATPDDPFATTSMQLDPGSAIDVSGGAQLTSSGTISGGRGGSITINAATSLPSAGQSLTGPMPPTSLEFGATLSGYGLYDGGKLSISAAGVCIAASNCSGSSPSTTLWLTPQFFNSGGFAGYSITADQNGLSIAPGMTLDLVQHNFELDSGYAAQPNAPSIEAFTTVGVLPLDLRQPDNLTLSLYYPANSTVDVGGGNYVSLLAGSATSLVIPQGDVISTDPSGSISLGSDTAIDVEGTLRAPGGTISLTLGLPPGSSNSGVPGYLNVYDPAQAIWLGPAALLDASGADEIFPNKLGEPTGSVLAGGTVSLNAQIGSLELLPGSVIDVAGTSGTIDIVPVGGGSIGDQRIASAGGTIDLSDGAGGVIGGSLLAAAGSAGGGANQPGGGSLYVVDNGAVLAGALQGASSRPPNDGAAADADDIVISSSLAPSVVAPGSQVPDALQGMTLLAADTLQQGGFNLVSLQSYLGEIDLTGGVTLSAAQEVSLDAEVYSVEAGTTANVNAPYVEFGSSSTPYGTTPTLSTVPSVPVLPASDGTGALHVSGGFIELYGTSSLSGIGSASFISSGDLRVQGLQGDTSADPDGYISGGLYAGGTINLAAQQIYPSTLTQFVISADPEFVVPANSAGLSSNSLPTSGSITITGSEGTNTDLLSAGGSLTLVADSIAQDGVLRAPFGTIALDATSLTLGPGSLTSTSADGMTIPFGTTEGNTGGGSENSVYWVYSVLGITTVYGSGGAAPPSQHVELNGSNINIETGAAIDVSGGGDLQAFEWVPGPGGTQDVLDCSDCFAIIPSLKANVAPYDPAIVDSYSSSPQDIPRVGEAVYLSAGSGVPAGTYLLLPARYALLSGAYLVTPIKGSTYQDIQPGQSFQAPDGGTIVSGYLTEMGLSYGSSRLNGFEVTPSAVFLNESQYSLTTGNSFFSAQIDAATSEAADEAASAMRLPQDAGVIDIAAGITLALNGTLQASTASGARGAEVDISNPNIVVTDSGSAATQPGALVLTTSSLDQFGAQTLLLGGQDDNGTVNTAAQTITILGGASLTAPQVLLTAQNGISVESGASITAAGPAPPATPLSFTGSGAFLGVSAGPQVTVATTQSAQGTLDLAPGSSLTANQGSIYLDATAGISTGGAITANGGNLAVQAPQIVVGDAPSASGIAVLGSNVLGSGNLDNLLLVSPAAITIASGAATSAQNITLDAPGIVNGVTSGQSAALSASNSISLGNTQGTSVGSTGSQAGSLTLSAPEITLQSAAPATAGAATPTFGIEGFSTVALDAQSTLIASNDVNFSTDGSLSVTASAVTTGAGAAANIAAGGTVVMLAPASPEPAAGAALGGTLAITGTGIDIATALDLPSGGVTLTASGGDITLESTGTINVAGVDEQYGATTVATPGGSVALSATGNVTLASGSTINVSAGAGGNAGSLSISAPAGTVTADGTLAGTGAAQGGSFSVAAENFGGGSANCGGFCAVSAAINAGGFTDSQSYWLQGTGDLTLTGNLNANTVLLEADQGSIYVYGTIDADGNVSGSSSSGSGGSVTLSAANGITLESGGAINAQATSPGANGGTVELDLGYGNPAATLALNQGSTINVGGGGPSTSSAGAGANVVLTGSNGSVLLRVPYLTLENVTKAGGGVTLGGQIEGASSTVVEAYQQVPVVSDTSGNVDITDVSSFESDASTMAAAVLPAVEQLSSTSGVSLTLEPGVEIDATGDITLDTPWDLSTLRFQDASGADDLPGILTLRAGGSVTFNDPLSDGFTSATSGTLMAPGTGSWSYRIVAGADMNASNPLAVATTVAQPPADVTIGSSTSGAVAVRTGTGFIDVAASGDFVLANQDSVLYTAGEADGTPPIPTCGGSTCPRTVKIPKLPSYAVAGGNIDINVGGDVDGSAEVNQFVNAWLWRQGGQGQSGGQAPAEDAPVAWSVQYADFAQGIGALGGGNVTIRAGGDINDFSASIASVGVAQNGGNVAVMDGGTLTVSAAGSILGGSYYVGLGSVALSAGGAIGVGAGSTSQDATSPLIGLGEASASVTARGDVQVSDIVSPTLLNSGVAEGANSQDYFATYGSASAVTLTSIGGGVTLDDEATAIGNQYGTSFSTSGSHTGLAPNTQGTPGDVAPGEGAEPVALDVLAPTLNVDALSGDIDISRDITLFPSSQGNLQLLASGNVNLGENGVTYLVVPDAEPTSMPSIADPAGDELALGDVANIASGSPYVHGSTPLFGSVSAFDHDPVQVVALAGDITFAPTTAGSTEADVWSGKPVTMSAGGDVIDPNITAQNLTAGDVTSITAGGDIAYPQTVSSGTIQGNGYGITVAGPGELQLSAGGNVDLGTSSGITTVGNQQNAALPSSGANISVQAGVGANSATAAQYNAFIQQYIDGSSDFDGQLVSYVEQVTGQAGLTDSEAKQVFAGMTDQQQRTFVEQLFFHLLQTYGTEAVKSGNNADYAGAYAAIQTLFPGANALQAAQDPFSKNGGNISLYFSQIYTEDGGDISLLAPGGEINVGLAVSPTTYGVGKSPNQLGIVTDASGDVDSFSYGDFEVNESRVFSAGGGNILVWSAEGNVDAGRGSKTSLSAAAPTVSYDDNGFASLYYYPPATGSGIQALADTPGVSPGTVYLFAPHGVVNANEAGIVAGNLVVGAVQVLGTNNIQVSGSSFGVPTTVTGLGTLALSGSTAAAGAASSAQSSVAQSGEQGRQEAPKAAAELRWLDVFVLGFGEQTCSASDIECLKRQKVHHAH